MPRTLEQNIRAVTDYLLEIERAGTPYHWWREGDPALGAGPPAHAVDRDAPRPGDVKAVFCAGLGNLALRFVGKPVPKLHPYNGGTEAWLRAYDGKWRPFRLEDAEEGDVAFRPFNYDGPADQGHWAYCSGRGANAKVIQSYAYNGATVKPGVTSDVTLARSHEGGYYVYLLKARDWLAPVPSPVRDKPAARENGEKRAAAPAASPPRPRETVATVVVEAEKKEHKKVFAKGRARDGAPKPGEILTVAGLREVFPLLGAEDAQRYHPHLVEALREAEVNTPWRMAHFLGQVGHESGELRWWEEFADGTAYEGRSDLGNVVPGDGPRYKGRCPIMLTGRANYRAAGGALGVDLEGNPGLAKKPEVGFRIAAWYWTGRGLNDLADRRDEGFKEITYRINGGYNGYTDRLEKYNRAKAVLGVDRRRSRRIKCNFVSVGELDSRIAHQAAAVLNKRGICASVTVDDGVKVLGDVFADEPLGARQMIVVGRPALDALTAEARKFALYPPDLSKTDFVSAAGKSYEQTIRRTAESLALYDGSGAAGRRLLRELDDALEEPQGRDGTEGPEHTTATNGYREETGSESAREPFLDRSEEIESSYRDDSNEDETPEQREPSAGDPESEAPEVAPGRGGRGKRRGAVRNLGPARNPVIWSQLAALLTDFAVLYGLMPQGIDQAQTQELIAVALAMVGSHAGFGAAARQSVRPLAKEREES
jgi:predicted chitinase